jgi:hypothetical protein
MKPVASLVSELGARVLAPGVDLLLSFSQLRYNWNWETVGTYSNFLGGVGGTRSGYLRWPCF